jgi:predicted RNA-binding protein YlxR (DUF448 family)
MRRCVGCGASAPAPDLVRFALDDGTIVLDRERRLPGRGAWLHPLRECLEEAQRRRAFQRALRAPGAHTLPDYTL